MNQLSRRPFVITTGALAVCMLLLLAATNGSAQDYPVGVLQITSPADGTVVHPGQTISVTVAPVSGNVFNGVMLVGGPFSFSAPLYSAPYQFTLTVPQNITAAGKYQIRAIGGRQGQTFGSSNPISLDVEPAAAITRIRLDSTTIPFSFPGEVATLHVFGTFADGSALDITHSTGTTYSGGHPSVATVSSNGLVTAANPAVPGYVAIVVQYGDQKAVVTVSTTLTANASTGPPNLTSLSPTSGPVGTSVTITGANFWTSRGTPGTGTVTFNGTPATTGGSWSPTSIHVRVPSGATTGNVVVTVEGAASNGLSFTVTPPSIASLNPTSGAVGTPVTITGTNFGTTQGASTVKFNGTAATPTSWSANSILAPVPGSATTGNVVVTVGATASNGLNFTVQGTTNGISLVQREGKDAGTTTSSSLAFETNNAAGNWIAVCVRAGHSGEVFTVTDSRGNTYHQAVQKDITVDAPNGNTLAIYYAENISAGPNTVTVSDTISGTLRFAILEYTGVATLNSLDVTASSQGTGVSPTSGSATTTSDGDLLLGAIDTADAATFTAGTGFTLRNAVPAEPNTKLIVEDKIQTPAGSASATASLAASDPWGALLAAFKKAHP